MVDKIKERILIEIEEFKLGGITPFEALYRIEKIIKN